MFTANSINTITKRKKQHIFTFMYNNSIFTHVIDNFMCSFISSSLSHSIVIGPHHNVVRLDVASAVSFPTVLC